MKEKAIFKLESADIDALKGEEYIEMLKAIKAIKQNVDGYNGLFSFYKNRTVSELLDPSVRDIYSKDYLLGAIDAIDGLKDFCDSVIDIEKEIDKEKARLAEMEK